MTQDTSFDLGFVVLIDLLGHRCIIQGCHSDVFILTWHLKTVVVSKNV